MVTCYRRNYYFIARPVAEETGLSLALSETPKTGFVATRPKYALCSQMSALGQ